MKTDRHIQPTAIYRQFPQCAMMKILYLCGAMEFIEKVVEFAFL
jgi:hypothetical protein